MCGIAGFTHTNWVTGPDRIRRAASTLQHRGPDQQGVFQSKTVALAATRLKIIDLDGGDQPIRSDDGDAVIVFNGEIYNHQELRQELEGLGHRFRSRCDTEVVLRAFLEWDLECFSRLRGMFALAIWSESRKRLVLGRDRLGIKPLYIAHRGGDIFFGSELKAIFVHPEIPRQLSLNGLDCYLSMNYVPSPWTLVEGIEKLAPGHWLEWKNGTTRSECYWQLPLGIREQSLESAAEHLDFLLRSSIREHLISDVPLGVWLSGGLDSSAILHYAAAQASSRLKTFSISFRGRSFDETAYIRKIVEQYQTEHEEVDLNPSLNLQDAIAEFAYYSDEPSADAGALPVWFLSKLCKTRTTVALSGEGADELFGGYLTHRASLLANYARKLPRPALRFALDQLRRLPVSDEKIGLEYKLKRFLEGCALPGADAHVYWNGAFSGEQKQDLLVEPLPPALDQVLNELRAFLQDGDRLGAYLWFDQKYYLPDDILYKVDRISMAHAVEVRPPFLDHRIAEFAASLPSSLKIRGSRQKVVLKELMKDKLPVSTLRRKKLGLDIPAHDWFRGHLRSLLEDTLAEGTFEYGEVFRAGAVRNLLNSHMERRANLGYQLWGLMILFLWMKKWRIQLPARQEKSALEKTGVFI
ncbi:MAG TPA: asparagine synthase (glutamine-hydrolyzing) [Candidatus Angelobacter sp.]|nr:asparagine synthase (glutamine-hydrolyzing) [Candidatus Angelobacter sp.]